MDSLSQVLLGAALAEVTIGRKIGRSALVVGGALGTLPDLDVLVQYTDAVESFTYHRSWSHSLFVLSLASLPIAWLLDRVYRSRCSSGRSSPTYRRWLLCTWAVLFTHPLLDGFTIYGTQLLWPLPTVPIAWGSLFIIDPLYTVPLLIAFVVAWRQRGRAFKAASVALLVSTSYIGVSLVSQQHARSAAVYSLSQQSISSDHVLIAPLPFSVLWRIVSMDDEHYYEGFYSLLDQDHDIQFDQYPTNRELIELNKDKWQVARMDWFTRGFMAAKPQDDRLLIHDLRMGVESSYVFRFDVGPLDGSEENAISQQLPLRLNSKRLKALIRRATDESVAVPVDE